MSDSHWTKESLDAAFAPYLDHEKEDTPQARKKARILRAATLLFEEQGYRKTSVDEIASKAEVAKGTVYLYFESKAKLLVHAIAVQKKVLMSSIEPLFTGAIPERDRLHYWVKVMLKSAREVPLATRLMRGDNELAAALDDIGELAEENTARGEAWIGELIRLAAPDLDDDEVKLRAHVLMTMGYVSGMLLDDRLRFGRSYEEMTDELADMLVYGTIHRPPEPDEGDR